MIKQRWRCVQRTLWAWIDVGQQGMQQRVWLRVIHCRAYLPEGMTAEQAPMSMRPVAQYYAYQQGKWVSVDPRIEQLRYAFEKIERGMEILTNREHMFHTEDRDKHRPAVASDWQANHAGWQAFHQRSAH
jgi:hypothetical protein